MSTKDPTDYCAPYADASVRVEIEFPWGLPKIEAGATMQLDELEGVCKQLELLLAQLKMMLGFMYPLLRIIDCLKLLVDVVKKIIETFDPANIADIAANLAELATMIGDVDTKCVDLFAELTFVIPTPFCKLIVDIMNALIALVDCVKAMATISIGLGDQITALNASADLNLQAQVPCLQAQKAKVDAAIEEKLNSVQVIIDVVNTLIGFVPPLQAALGAEYPITLGALSINIPALDNLRALLVTIRDLAQTCA